MRVGSLMFLVVIVAACGAAPDPGSIDASPWESVPRSTVPGDLEWPQFGYSPGNRMLTTARLPASPELRWRVALDAWATGLAGPFVGSGRLFVPVYGAELFALDPATGSLLWKTEGFRGPKYGAGAASGTLVYTPALDDVDGDIVVALRADTGSEVWRAPLMVWSALKVDAGRLYATGLDDARLHALDAATGETLWVSEVECVGPPALDGGRAYCASTAALHAFDAASGALLLSVPAEPGSAVSSPAVAEGRVYYVGARLYAHDALDGTFLWSADFSAADRPTNGGTWIETAPAVGYGRVYVAGLDGTVAFDAATGAELWRRPGAMAGSSLVLADGCVVDNRPAMLDAVTGEVLWEADGLAYWTVLAVTDGHIFGLAVESEPVVSAWGGEVPGEPPAY